MATRKQKQRHPNCIHLTVANVPRAVRFYEDKLGFRLLESFPTEKPVWAKLVYDGQPLMLGELPSLQEARQFGMDQAEIEVLKQDARAFARGGPGVGVAYYVKVKDVDRFARRLKKQRVKPLLPPKTQFYGIRDVQVTDLDGYRLVFFHDAPPPAPSGEPAPPPSA
ncbi:MAG: VOC family protein [Planctomycetota bacterium]